MHTDLKSLIEALVMDGNLHLPDALLPSTNVVELDSEQAWADFQDSQLASDQTRLPSGPK